ncbi:hypothetical protein AB0J21_30470 [Streptomyces sp. NPDC049954]|uniref:hypothetical protein n=1 Tax=Streptomyces sp. NPDC049954 TaxID=3155779 RepID=UPI00342CAAD8
MGDVEACHRRLAPVLRRAAASPARPLPRCVLVQAADLLHQAVDGGRPPRFAESVEHGVGQGQFHCGAAQIVPAHVEPAERVEHGGLTQGVLGLPRHSCARAVVGGAPLHTDLISRSSVTTRPALSSSVASTSR